MDSFTFESAVRGFHVYKSVWNPVIDERLSTEREFGNSEDLNAVCVRKAKGSLAMFHESFLVYFGTLFPTAAPSNVR